VAINDFEYQVADSPSMSALGHKRHLRCKKECPLLPPKADIPGGKRNVR